jgi:hypothetical protein
MQNYFFLIHILCFFIPKTFSSIFVFAIWGLILDFINEKKNVPKIKQHYGFKLILQNAFLFLFS